MPVFAILQGGKAMNTIKTIIIVFSIFWTATANAAGPGVHVGGALGFTSLADDDRHNDYVDMRLDDESSGGQIFAGMYFDNWIGIEATLANLGEYEYTDPVGTISDKFGVMAVTAMFRTPMGRSPISFYGKAGLGIISWEEEDFAFGTKEDDTGGALALGFGLILTPRPDSPMSFRFSLDIYSFTLDDLVTGYEYNQSIAMSSFGMQFNF